MQNITVSKGTLLEALEANRAEHRELFLAAQKAYREKVIELLDQRLAQARSGGRIELYFALPEPEDHTDSFDTAISMIEWEVGDTIVLSEKDFQRYVLNKWEWRHSFEANTQSYLAS